MLVRYQRTLADLEAYYDFYCDSTVTQKAINRYRTRMSVGVGMVVFGMFCVMSAPASPLAALGVGAVSALLFASQASRIYKNAVRGNIRRCYAPQSGAFFDKELELELVETGFILRTARMETKIPWRTLERIDSRPGYTYLCIDALNAISIPHKGIVAGDFPAMLAEIGRRYQPDQRLESAAAPLIET